MNKTVTYDPAKYKLVPSSVAELIESGDLEPILMRAGDEDLRMMLYRARQEMLAAVPDQLPGVVEHSGEPAIYFNGKPHYTHPAPSQPSKAPSAELTWLYTHCKAIGMKEISDSGKWEEDIALFTIRLKEKQPSAESLVAAALERASNFLSSIGMHDIASDIRCLDKQKIIDGAGK